MSMSTRAKAASAPKVTPATPRRSGRISSLPQKLREEATEGEKPKAKVSTVSAIPKIAHDLLVVGEIDLMEDTPPGSPKKKDPSPPSSSSESSDDDGVRHPSQNYTLKELYLKWRFFEEALSDLKEDFARKSRELKTSQKEVTYLERKCTTHESTEKKLQ